MTSRKTAADTPESAAGSATAERAQDWMAAMQRLQQAGLGPLHWLGNAWMESAIEINRELLDFLSRRVAEDVRTQHEILNCTDPARLRDIQLRFMQRAIEDYTAETGALSALSKGFLERLARRTEN
ncbi:MAG: hypothetical protein Kow0058_09690 [Roseovarius sp.]